MSDQAKNNNVAPMPKRASHGPLSRVTSLQDAFDHPDFQARLRQAAPKHLSPDRMLAVCIQAVQKTPKLRDCGIMSLLGAFVSLASVGLEPNTALGHAYLIPFDKRGKNPQTGKWEVMRTDVQVIFGYQGLLDLAFRSGFLKSVHCDVVWPGDEFDFWYGSNSQLKHRPRGQPRQEGQLPELAYMHANMKEGGESFEVMPLVDILAVRDKTQAYQTAVRALKEAQEKGYKVPATYTEAPWVAHPVAMFRKTVFRAGSKWLPKSIELAAALQLDELQDQRRADFGKVIDGTADVITGLDALDDETGALDLGGGSFTGYSQQQEREPAPATTTTSQTQEDNRAAHQARQQPPAEQPKPANTGFQAYLVDESGEVVADVYTDAGLFAEAFVKLWEISQDRETLSANNSEAMLAALAFPNARGVFETLGRSLAEPQQGQTEGQTEEDPAVREIPLPRNGRGPDIAGWTKTAREALAQLNREQLPDWIGNNEPVWRIFPGSKRLEVEKLVADRCAAVGLPWAPTRKTEDPGHDQQEGGE